MHFRIRDVPDLLTGLLYILLGAGAASLALTYRLWSGYQVGPGYFPFGLGIVLAILGAIVCIGSCLPSRRVRAMEGLDLRPFVIVIGSVVLFGLALPVLGLWLSVMLLVGVSSLADTDFHWRSTLVSMVLLPTAAVGIFIYGLKLPVAALPQFLGAGLGHI